MTNVPFRILCVGPDNALLRSRRTLLEHQGYEVFLATVPMAYQRLQSSRFDLVVVSRWSAVDEGEALYSSIPLGTCALLLQGLTVPSRLIDEVAACFRRRAVSPACCPLAVSR